MAVQLRAGGDSFVMGAFDSAELVGMAGFHREDRTKLRHKTRIWGVFVLPTHRGKGIARAMMAAIVERARALADLRQIQLTVAATQAPARRLYLELGFRPFGFEPEALCVDGVYIDDEHLYLPLR